MQLIIGAAVLLGLGLLGLLTIPGLERWLRQLTPSRLAALPSIAVEGGRALDGDVTRGKPEHLGPAPAGKCQRQDR